MPRGIYNRKQAKRKQFKASRKFQAPKGPRINLVIDVCGGGGGGGGRSGNISPKAEYASNSVLGLQEGGDHYKRLGHFQPWEVLKAWLSPEEFHGYMKGVAIAYLAREQDKGKIEDIKKAIHTLQALVEMEAA